MLEYVLMGYGLYLLIAVYTSVSQIGFVKRLKGNTPVILQKETYEQAANYSIEKEYLSLYTHFYDAVVFIVWIVYGFMVLDTWITIENDLLKTLVFVQVFIIINWLMGLPFEWYTLFKLDKKHQFSNMTYELYIKDTLKKAVLFLVFGSAVITVIALIIDSFTHWWMWGFCFLFTVIIVINMLYPVIRDKFFDTFESLNDEVLEKKIQDLLQKVGFKSSGIYQVDASKRDNRLNAYFGGLGGTKRVVLYDTLVQKLTHNELLAVLGHELGHFKNGDMVKNISVMGVVLFLFFFLFGNVPHSLFTELGMSNEPYSIIVLFLIFSPIFSFFLMPLISFISRHNEYAADKFGSRLSTANDLINALLKLVNENRSFPFSHPSYVFFYYSHPPLIDRLKELGYKQ